MTSDTSSTHQFPPLYARASNGKTKYWEIKVYETTPEAPVYINTKHGYEGSNLVETITEIKTGKNIGRANETTKWEQAIAQATSTWQKKKDKGYSETLSTSSPIKLPMLAHDYFKRGKDITFPCYVQPKLNGVRMLAYCQGNNVTLYSRGGKIFNTLNHIAEELKLIMKDGQYLDGEIYNHDLDLQEIVSILKCEKEDRGRDKLQYWIYDVPSDLIFNNRLRSLQNLQYLLTDNTNLVIVNTDECTSKHHVKDYFKQFITEGMEGLMLRNKQGSYKYSHRSADLQKYKEFQSEEFEIIDVVGGEAGKSEENCAIFVCKTAEGVTFNVRPKGARELRVKWLNEERLNLIGKHLTVKYFEYTPDGVPFHPVGEAIRDYE